MAVIGLILAHRQVRLSLFLKARKTKSAARIPTDSIHGLSNADFWRRPNEIHFRCSPSLFVIGPVAQPTLCVARQGPESTHEGVNQRSKYVTQVHHPSRCGGNSHLACVVPKLHQRYILFSSFSFFSLTFSSFFPQ